MHKIFKDNSRLKYSGQFNLELLNKKDYPILKKRGIGPNIFKYASIAIIDCMRYPYYCFSYPSYQYLADKVLVGKTSISDHIHLVENSGLFRVKKLSARDCKRHLWINYGHQVSTKYPKGPAIYEINYNSPFWSWLQNKFESPTTKGTKPKVPQQVMAAMLERAFRKPIQSS